MSVGPLYEGIFFVLRNPRDTSQEIVSWDVIDIRDDTIVASHLTRSEAVEDMQTRNKALSSPGG